MRPHHFSYNMLQARSHPIPHPTLTKWLRQRRDVDLLHLCAAHRGAQRAGRASRGAAGAGGGPRAFASAQGDVGRAKLGEDRDNFQVQTMFLYLNVVPMFFL